MSPWNQLGICSFTPRYANIICATFPLVFISEILIRNTCTCQRGPCSDSDSDFADPHHAQESSTNADGTATGQEQRLLALSEEVNAAALRFYRRMLTWAGARGQTLHGLVIIRHVYSSLSRRRYIDSVVRSSSFDKTRPNSRGRARRRRGVERGERKARLLVLFLCTVFFKVSGTLCLLVLDTQAVGSIVSRPLVLDKFSIVFLPSQATDDTSAEMRSRASLNDWQRNDSSSQQNSPRLQTRFATIAYNPPSRREIRFHEKGRCLSSHFARTVERELPGSES